MRTPAIVMADEITEDPFQVTLVERNQKVETLPSYGSHQPLAVRIGLGSPNRGLQNSDAEVL